MITRLRRWLFNLWLDHWYLPRHPHQGMVVPLPVLYAILFRDIRAAITARTEEADWFQAVPLACLEPSGQENRIPLIWGASGITKGPAVMH